TSIDRAMVTEARDGVMDLRPESGQVRSPFDRTLCIARLRKLERYGLAQQGEPGVWTVSDRLEPMLRELGEGGDIVKAINRALATRGQQRIIESFDLHGEEAGVPIVGRVIDKRLVDELGDRVGVVIDGIDGRVHHVALRDSLAAEELPIG